MAAEALQRGEVVVGTVHRREDLRRFAATVPGRAVARSATPPPAGGAPAVGGRRGRPVDVLIDNVGYGLAGVVEELDLDALPTDEVDVNGQVVLIQAVLPGMRAAGGVTC